ncbi:MAG TPA: CRTAC1 family protein [Terriglobales bacterium]|nr:CRTAC1 family protein [Terriglobales bacterium]
MALSFSCYVLPLSLCLFAVPCPSQDVTTTRFEDISEKAGLTVSHIGSPEKRYIVESTSGGVGFIDCDNDGKLDILMSGGSNVDHFRQNGGDPMVRLFRQDSDLHFIDITEKAGLTRKGWGMGISVMDYDNDGLPDIYVTGFGGNVLYHNLGNCKFEDVTEKAGVRSSGYNMGPAWADYDRSGYVSLFVPRYLEFDMNKLPTYDAENKGCEFRGISMECARRGHSGQTDFLFRNRGNGTFEDVSKKAGVDDPGTYLGMQGIWADYDNDGWPDLYVTNDGGPNYLYHNKHDGTFEDVGLLSGASLSLTGVERAGMGVDFGDFDRDGQLDVYVTNYTEESDALFWNQGEKGFLDIAEPAGLFQPTYFWVGWGAGFFDADNNGWPDIFVAHGHVYPQMDLIKGGAPFKEPVLLFRNNRNRTFTDITALAGLDQLPLLSRRGVAFGDVNNDGKIDVLILNVAGPPTLLINRTESAGHAVLFKLIGTKSNKAAIGARVTITAGGLKQIDEVRSGGSYLSQNDLRLHFGLGKETLISNVEISWPSGKKEQFEKLPADAIYTVVEGGGITHKMPLIGTTPAETKH